VPARSPNGVQTRVSFECPRVYRRYRRRLIWRSNTSGRHRGMVPSFGRRRLSGTDQGSASRKAASLDQTGGVTWRDSGANFLERIPAVSVSRGPSPLSAF
jgi:hypothetical protein